MIRMMMGALALAAAMPAFAQEAQTARFQVTGVEVALPIPKGFCLPRGKGAVVAQLLAAGDTSNVTHLTLDSCNEQAADIDYYLFKTTRSVLAIQVSREEWIAALIAHLDDPAVKTAIDPSKIKPEVEREFETMFGQKASVGGDITWLGHDDTCVYLGGVMSFETEGVSYKRAVSGCMTAVGGRSVNVYRYSEGVPANVTRYLADVKAIALSMQGAPAH